MARRRLFSIEIAPPSASSVIRMPLAQPSMMFSLTISSRTGERIAIAALVNPVTRLTSTWHLSAPLASVPVASSTPLTLPQAPLAPSRLPSMRLLFGPQWTP
jgi:hypothetical protein